jgi:thiaminase/transcriptional activator TenA
VGGLTPLAADLFHENMGVAEACLEHPFVAALGDGTLDPDRFREYVAQDAFFLRAFARAYAVAAARAPDMEAFESFLLLIRGAMEELSLHASFAKSLEIDLGAVEPLPATLAYTEFLLATAWHEGLPEILAAMAPCMRLYAWLGGELAGDGIPDHRYADWIRTYSSEEFGALADRMDALLDAHAADAPSVRDAYAKAMRLELAFFDTFAPAG